MKKVISSLDMISRENLSYENGYVPKDFMLKAGENIAFEIDQFISETNLSKKVSFICGKGNNSGDAYVAAGHLLNKSYQIEVYQCVNIDKMSPLCKIYHDIFQKKGGHVIIVEDSKDLNIKENPVIIDALFGTGLKGPPREPFKSIIEKINHSHCKIISIDLPSGLDGNTGETLGVAIQADLTLTLGLPKIGSFLRYGWNHVKSLKLLDFGLPEKFIDSLESYLWMFEKEDLVSYFPKLIPNRHKYQAGYVVGIAGSKGMTGAAYLSTASALHGGAGMVRLLCPEFLNDELSLLPEIVKTLCERNDIEKMLHYINSASAAFIGPGIGLDSEFDLKTLLKNITVPLVLDADALNRIALENILLPKNCILTPHMGEMGRLLGKKLGDRNENLLEECQNYVDKFSICLILKGGPSFIFFPNKPIVVIPHGTPGMATAGSGDVLTGLIASLCAQGLSPHKATIAAGYIHAKAGENAAKIKTDYCMIASDIIDSFPTIFKECI